MTEVLASGATNYTAITIALGIPVYLFWQRSAGNRSDRSESPAEQ